MKVGDRVKCVRYEGIPPKEVNKVLGATGIVIGITPDYIDVALDNPIVGMQEWLFQADEVEVVR